MGSNVDCYIDRKKMKLEICSPVCVSSGNQLSAIEYIYDYNERYVYFLNQLGWHRYIYDKKLFDEYKQAVERKSLKTLYNWLTRVRPMGVREIISNPTIVMSKARVDSSVEAESLNDIHFHLKTATGKPLIPGSTIKGIIRAALLYEMIRKDPTMYWRKNEEFKSIKEKKEVKKKSKEVARLEENLFRKLDLTDEKGKRITHAVADIMRGISCSDAICIEPFEMVIAQKIDINVAGKVKEEKRVPLSRECLSPGTKLSFQLSVDKRFTACLGVETVQDVLDKVEILFNHINKVQEYGFGDEYRVLARNSGKSNIYIGAGIGLIPRTMIYAASENLAEGNKILQHILNILFPKGDHIKHGKKISPYALKATSFKKKNQLMGLARIDIDE